MASEVQIRPVLDPAEASQLEVLQRAVWPGSETEIVPAHIILALARHGGHVLGAFSGTEVVGFVFGFLGTDHESPGELAMSRLKLNSHMMGVHPDWRDRGIGMALKRAQRQHALSRGIRLITWTYDPLQSRNAHLNIRKLGAICRDYQRDVYGEMGDELNRGIPSDRFLVEWWITSSRVQSRLEATRPPLDLAHFLGAGARKINPTHLVAGDFTRPPEELLPLEGSVLLVEIPPALHRIKERRPTLARLWRTHTRDIFERAFDAGYMVTDFIHLRGERVPRSYYVLSHGERTLG